MRVNKAIFLASVLATGACGGGSDGDGTTAGEAFDEPLQFQGTQAFLPGLNVDTGWLPEGSPAAVRATVTASGELTVVAQATTDGTTLTPVPASGELTFGGGFALEVSARIDAAGVEYEGVVESFDYTVETVTETFEPFAIGAPVSVTAALPARELGEVPIPSVPGASLRMEVTGGELTNAFTGRCAEAADGFGQYAGETLVSGTVACAATIVIEVPLIGAEEFGPFAFDVPIPEATTPIDLGTRSLTTGQEADTTGLCDAAGTTTSPGTGSPADSSGGGTDPTGDTDPTSDTDSDTGDTDPTGDDTTDDDGTTTGDPIGDPDYPPVVDDVCPGDSLPATVTGEDTVCLPPCDGNQQCPGGATGTASGVCALNPDSSYFECIDAAECLAGELCVGGLCVVEPPTHCVLSCEMGQCPQDMTCISGLCTYA